MLNTNQIGNDKAKDPAIGNRGFKKILALLSILCFYIARKKNYSLYVYARST